jgi:hypothetical protein
MSTTAALRIGMLNGDDAFGPTRTGKQAGNLIY